MTCKKLNITNNWYTSFGDFLTLILCFFLVIISNSFKNNPVKVPHKANEEQISYSLKNEDLVFTLPSSLENKINVLKLNDTYLSDNTKSTTSYMIKIDSKEFDNNIDNFATFLKNLSLSKDFGLKVVSFKKFDDFQEFLAIKRQFSDRNIDVSEFKMSHSDKNEIILRVYKKI